MTIYIVIIGTALMVLWAASFIMLFVQVHNIKSKMQTTTTWKDWLEVKDADALTVKIKINALKMQYKVSVCINKTLLGIEINSSPLIMEKLMQFCKEYNIDYEIKNVKA